MTLMARLSEMSVSLPYVIGWRSSYRSKPRSFASVHATQVVPERCGPVTRMMRYACRSTSLHATAESWSG
eukprot:7075200-Prymnesium_polylepis.1